MSLIPEGTYKIHACSAALGYTAKETAQVAVELELLEGGEGLEGQRITWYGYFSEKTVDRTIESLRTLGWQGDDLSDLSTVGSVDAYAVIGHEDDQEGRTRARVRWINAGGGLALKERMDEDQARAFAESMKGHVLAAKQRKKGMPSASNGGARPARAPAAAPARKATTVAAENLDDDDIPF